MYKLTTFMLFVGLPVALLALVVDRWPSPPEVGGRAAADSIAAPAGDFPAAQACAAGTLLAEEDPRPGVVAPPVSPDVLPPHLPGDLPCLTVPVGVDVLAGRTPSGNRYRARRPHE